MKYDEELVCDGCATDIHGKHNLVKLNNAEYELCLTCYQKLLDWFNKEITV